MSVYLLVFILDDECLIKITIVQQNLNVMNLLYMIIRDKSFNFNSNKFKLPKKITKEITKKKKT